MKALVKYTAGEGNVGVLDVAEPECKETRIKLEIAYCGVCGPDIHVLHDTFRNFLPVILGHEFAGTIVEVGSKITGFKPVKELREHLKMKRVLPRPAVLARQSWSTLGNRI